MRLIITTVMISHDRFSIIMFYSKHDDTKTMNEVCDKTMLGEFNGIVNSTLRERIDKSIVEKLIKAKVSS